MKTEVTAVIIKINENTIEVNGQKLSLNDEAINKVAGADYLVYEHNGNYFISADANENDGVVIGGFHYSLIPEDFMARNRVDEEHAKNIRGINAYSIWDNEHRPTCKPNGMSYIPKEDMWMDIYMCGSEHEKFGTSAPHQHFLAGGNSYGRVNPNGDRDFLYKDFEAVAQKHGKRFITWDEFISGMRGVKEFASAEDSDNGITKHHPDFVSMYGIEQATGHNWIWSEKIDEEYAVILGGLRTRGVSAGSRASSWGPCVWYSYWGIGSRFACDPLHPVK
ncbi:MAG: hypothetical protein AB7D34_01270 [Sulfurimonas sp.]